MSKQLFSTQRYLQYHNEIVTPVGNPKGRREWIISRRLCHYRFFDLTDISPVRRDSVLQLKIQQWCPFQDYASYNIWQKGQVQVWIWDRQRQLNGFRETGLKKASALPETVLRTHSTTDSLQLLKCLEGFEGQIWKKGLLVGSRWWAQVPKTNEWINFQRTYGLPANPVLPTVNATPLLARPWGRNQTNLGKWSLLYQERMWVNLAIVIVTMLLTWYAVTIFQWQQALTQVQNQIEELNETVTPILTARTQALVDKQRLEQLLALNPHPSQLELMTQIAKKLPRNQARLISWTYQMDELRFTIETSKQNPTFYIKTFEKYPLFKEVKAEIKGTKSNQITISMQLF